MKCPHCGKDFSPVNEKQVCCSKKCSKAEWQKRKRQRICREHYARHYDNLKILDVINNFLEAKNNAYSD